MKLNNKKSLKKLSRDEVESLKRLLFGAEEMSKKFPNAWKQGLELNLEECSRDMLWGLVQKEGGPCGIIGAV